MSDLKSKLPDFKELGSMATKLFKDVKNSVSEIITDYKDKRAESAANDDTQQAESKAHETTETEVKSKANAQQSAAETNEGGE